jgi:hypothetical protein
MPYLIRVAMSLALLLCASSLAWSYPPAQDPKETGTITGRVMLDGRPSHGVIVMAISDQARTGERLLKPSGFLKAATDSDGRYRLEGLPAGTHHVTPFAPTLVNLGADKQETQVTITGGATVERIDFSLTRGGVITGKITDNEGRPVIAALVSLKPLDNNYPADFYSVSRDRMLFTDDRGVYRIFGLPAGRYLVSAGNSDNSPFGQIFAGQSKVRTYYPGVTDEPMARPVEVAAGAEAPGVDIKLGVAPRGFVVSGRVVYAETRKPVGNSMVAYGTKALRDSSGKDDEEDHDDEGLGGVSGFTATNARGEFRLESVAPGSYRVRTLSMAELSGATEYYADPVDFEVRSSNLDNLEIPVYRGASISGVVVLENSASVEAREQIAQLRIAAEVVDKQSSSRGSTIVAADGSFRIGGLRGGKARIGTELTSSQKLSLLRIERDGVDQHDGLLVQPNEQITRVRLVMVEANCVIRGHITPQGGSLPAGSVTSAIARATSGLRSHSQWTGQVDEKGDFVIENLPPGSYEVWALNYVASSEARKQSTSGKQTVSVVSGISAEVNIVLDVTATERDK